VSLNIVDLWTFDCTVRAITPHTTVIRSPRNSDIPYGGEHGKVETKPDVLLDLHFRVTYQREAMSKSLATHRQFWDRDVYELR
jgi:hypothetical protein